MTAALSAPGFDDDSDANSARRRVVVRAAPRREPPFDDEIAARHLTVVGPHDRQLPFEDVVRPTPAPSRLRLLSPRDPFAVQPTSRSDLPPIEAFTRRFVIAVIEVAVGRRSAMQLAAHASAPVHAGLMRDGGKLARLGTAHRPAGIHSIHVSEPADGVAEVAVIVRVGQRFRALALRLEGLDGRWRCTRLQIG